MNPVLQSIIHTLAFYDAVGGVPLTKIELYKYLVATEGLPQLKFGHFLNVLENEWSYLGTYIDRKRGFYFLKKNTSGYARRVQGGKSGIKKWRIARRMARLISFMPYVRMVAITGSLALNSTNKQSDIDVLIAAKSGNIWTVRVFVSMLMQMLGKRRYYKFIRDRICLNHYISDSESVLRPNHLFSRHICFTLVPLWRQESYMPPFYKNITARLQTIRGGQNLAYFLRNIIELVLLKTFASKLERALKALQMRKIQGREFIADDNALVFHHPRPKNQEALYLYEQNLRELNLS